MRAGVDCRFRRMTERVMTFARLLASHDTARTIVLSASIIFCSHVCRSQAQFVADSDAVGESGDGAVATDPASVAVGPLATATGIASTAVGYNSEIGRASCRERV